MPFDSRYSKMKRSNSSDVPRWMATFADLMSLMLCFFVLLVAMAEIDALKFRVVIRSLENAFGVNNPVLEEIPKGTSIIKQTFSAGPPIPTVNNRVLNDGKIQGENLKLADIRRYQKAKLQALYEKLTQSLKWAIDQNLLSVETIKDQILIRINETASFPSASAAIRPAFSPVINGIAEALATVDGLFVVAGHTDNIPLHSFRYRSNWELSAARATSVVHALLDSQKLKPEQFRIEAYADTHPLVNNDTPANRAMNRRVEIGILNVI